MTLKTFCMTFFFKSVKCMNTIRVVQFFYYESMMPILCPKPLSFCANKPSLYSRNIVGILLKLIFFRDCVFLNNHNNVIFTWITCTRNIAIDNKVTDLILTSLWLVLIQIPLWLQCNVFILSRFVMACWYSCSILFVSCCRTWGNNTLQQCLLKSFVFGCWLENNSSYIHSSLMYRSSFCEFLGQFTVVLVEGTTTNWFLCWIFLLVQWSLTTHLAAFSNFSALHTSLARIQGLSLMVTTYNLTVLKVNVITGDIFIIISCPKRVTFFVIQRGYKIKSDYFYSLSQSGGTWVSSEISINSSRTKTLSGPSCE